jgi:hypothetical protein
MGWYGGVYSLSLPLNDTGGQTMIISAGFKIRGGYDVPSSFMANLFYE